MNLNEYLNKDIPFRCARFEIVTVLIGKDFLLTYLVGCNSSPLIEDDEQYVILFSL